MHNCLSSFENQTRKDFELVIVDDASTDESYERLLEYKKHSKLNIVLIRNKENKGPGNSRKIALNSCTSKYIGFCDCDDWVDEKYVEDVIDIIEKDGADLCMFNNYRVYRGKTYLHDVTTALRNATSRKEVLAYAPMSLCRVVVDKELVDDIDFYDLYFGEDGIVLMQMLIKARKIVYSSTPHYYYLMRETAAHAKPSKRCFKDAVNSYHYLKKYMYDNYYDEMVYTCIKTLIYGGTIQAFKAGVEKKEIKQAVQQFKVDNPHYLDNRYYKSLRKAKQLYVWFIYHNYFCLAKFLSYVHTFVMGKR